jgi:hypothetical protein
MADSSIFVALIAASAGVLGAAVSPFSTAYQNSRQAKRELEERHDTALRDACVDLLRAVGDLRDQVADNYDYSGGDEMDVRLAEMRKHVTAAKVDAVKVALLAPQALGQPARQLAEAADRVAVMAAKSTDKKIRAANRAPDFGELDDRIAVFSERAVDHAHGRRAVKRARGRRAVAPLPDAAATTADP